LLGPVGLPDVVVQPDEDHVKVVEVPEVLLEPGERARERALVLRVEHDREVGELAGPTDSYPQSVQTFHGRTANRFAMGRRQLLVSAVVGGSHGPTTVPERTRAGKAPEPLGDVVEEPCLALRAEEGAQELPSRPGIVLYPLSVLFDPLGVPTGRRRPVEPLEEGERDVPVADPSNETRKALHADVQRVEELALRAGEQRFPKGEAGPQLAHLTMEAMKALRGRVRGGDHEVDRLRDILEDPRDLACDELGTDGAVALARGHPEPSAGQTKSPT